jgi:hypothetical protein
MHLKNASSDRILDGVAMKKMILTSLLLATSFSIHAQGACEGEAQVLGQIQSVTFKPATSCVAVITNIESYSSNEFCPLSMDEIIATGITVPAINEAACKALIGQSLSGTVVKKGDVLNIE